MRKTRVGRILIASANLVFLVMMLTAVYSAIPPAYNVVISSATVTPTPSAQVISVTYTVTNNGFYQIDNFYVSISVYDQGGNPVNSTKTTPESIQRGSFLSGAITLDISQSYITAHPGDYSIVFIIHSEFAYGLIKFSVERPSVQHFP